MSTKVVHSDRSHSGWSLLASPQRTVTSMYETFRAVIVGRLISSAGGASVQQLSQWGADKRLIQRMCADGTLRRVKRGYHTLGGVASNDHWQRLRSEHLRTVAAMTNSHTVASFRSAALAFGLPVSEIPDQPEVIRPPTMSSLRGTRTLRRSLDDVEITSVRGVPVTTIERTALDVALDLPTPQALITLDAALRRGVSRTLLLQNLSSLGSVQGCRTARKTISWADPHSESALESRGRENCSSLERHLLGATSAFAWATRSSGSTSGGPS